MLYVYELNGFVFCFDQQYIEILNVNKQLVLINKLFKVI